MGNEVTGRSACGYKIATAEMHGVQYFDSGVDT